MPNGFNFHIEYPEIMRIYSSQPLKVLNTEDRKIVWDLMNEMLEAQKTIQRETPFFFEYKNVTVMFAPGFDFLSEIPDMPLPSLGGEVSGHLILAGTIAANDRLPFPSEESLL